MLRVVKKKHLFGKELTLLENDIFFEWTKLKDRFLWRVSVSVRVEKDMGKGDNAGHENLSFFHDVFKRVVKNLDCAVKC